MRAELRYLPATLGFAGIGALSATTMGVLGLAVPVVFFSGLLLFAQPFLGVLALTVFSHLDGVQKLLLGFLPLSAFKLIAAATAAIVFLQGRRFAGSIRDLSREPVAVCAVAFLALSLVSLVVADNRGMAIDAISTLISLYLLMSLVIILANNRDRAELLVWLLVVTSIVSALILMAELALGVTLVAQSEAATTARTSEGFQRSSGGSDYNPTTAASMLLTGVIFALAHMLETPRYRAIMCAVVLVGTLAVIMSFARSAFLAYAIVVVLLAWRHRKARAMPFAIIMAIIAAILAIPFIPVEYFERIGTIFGLGSGGDWTLGRRLTYNVIGLDLFVQNPIFGVGPGNFVHHFTDNAYRHLPGRTLLGRELHNMYLSVLVQYGLVGALAFFSMIGYAFSRLAAIRRNPADEGIAAMATALGYAFTAYLLASLFLPNEYTKYTWLLPALCVALHAANARELKSR